LINKLSFLVYVRRPVRIFNHFGYYRIQTEAKKSSISNYIKKFLIHCSNKSYTQNLGSGKF